MSKSITGDPTLKPARQSSTPSGSTIDDTRRKWITRIGLEKKTEEESSRNSLTDHEPYHYLKESHESSHPSQLFSPRNRELSFGWKRRYSKMNLWMLSIPFVTEKQTDTLSSIRRLPCILCVSKDILTQEKERGITHDCSWDRWCHRSMSTLWYTSLSHFSLEFPTPRETTYGNWRSLAGIFFQVSWWVQYHKSSWVHHSFWIMDDG